MNSPAPLPPVADSPINEIVLVDDDKLTIEIVSWIVRKTSYRSKLFTDPAEAMLYLKANTPKLLVVDFYMPCVTGLEFLTELDACTDLSRSSIFLCSAVPPPSSTDGKFSAMNVVILEKQVICDKTGFNALLAEHLQPVTEQGS